MTGLPVGVSEAEVLTTIERVVNLLGPKFQLPCEQRDDVFQQARLFAWEGICEGRFDPERGSLDGFLYRHVRNRLMNRVRDRVFRNEPACPSCHAGTPCQEGGCDLHRNWLTRNRRKAALAGGATPGDDDVHDQRSHAPPASQLVEESELAQAIDERLPVELRPHYCAMRDGAVVPVHQRRQVQRAVLAILDELGLSAKQLGVAIE